MDWDRANGSFFTAILIAHCPKLEGESSDHKATNGFCALQLLFTTCPTTGPLTEEKTLDSVSYSFCCILVYFLPPPYQRATSCICYCPGNQPSSPSFSGASPLTISGRLRGKPKSAAYARPPSGSGPFCSLASVQISLLFYLSKVHVSEVFCLSIKMPVRRGHVALQNTYLDTIIRKFDEQSKCK